MVLVETERERDDKGRLSIQNQILKIERFQWMNDNEENMDQSILLHFH